MRNITARRLKNEALDIMPDRILNSIASYPEHQLSNFSGNNKFTTISGGEASNPYKNFIRKYRRLHV